MDFPPVAAGFQGVGRVAMVVVAGHLRRPSVKSKSSAVSGVWIDGIALKLCIGLTLYQSRRTA